MRPILLLLFFLLVQQLSAQVNISAKDMVVKDSTGQIYPLEIWQALLFKGNYGLKPEDPKDKNTAFLLVKLTEEEARKKLDKMPKPRPSNSFKDGQNIRLFNETDLDGNKIKLKDSAGRIIVLNFWFINCPPCRKEIPDLNNLVDSFSKDGVIFVGVALDQHSDLKNFLKQMPFQYRIIANGRYLASDYKITSYPTHVIIDQEGKVYFHTSGLGPGTLPWLKKTIKELIAKNKKDTASN